MNRAKYIIASVMLLVLGIVLSNKLTAKTEAATTGRPNVLVLVNDDQRPEDIALRAQYMPKTYGPTGWMSTAKAVEYPQAQATNPNCCPSRASIMTGRYDHNNGVKTQADALKLNYNSTMQHYLHLADYQTGLVGKFLNSFPQNNRPPDFDDYSMYESSSYTKLTVNDNQKIQTITQYATTYWGNRMMTQLQKFTANATKPWFIYGTAHVPHAISTGVAVPETKYANAPTRNCVQPGEADLSDKPKYVGFVHKTPSYLQSVCQSQIRALMSYDDQLNRIFTYLQTTGQLSNTLVIVTTDNGYMWGEHNRDSKFVPYLPSIKVPLTVRWDGHMTPGVDNRLTTNIDYAPTIMAATGTTAPAGSPTFDGQSLLLPGSRTTMGSEYYFDSADAPAIPTWAQLTGKGWTYIQDYTTSVDSTQMTFEEYYNTTTDPGQLTNLLKDGNPANDPPNLAQLRAQLAAFRSCSGTNCP
jgi:N-acetylglucosamine-6-sulfatase